jgi:hypothetical protein
MEKPMARHIVSASALLPVPAQRIYAIIADYQNGHPHILPRPDFGELIVEQGGVGAGTVIHVQMRLLGQLQTFRATVTEPEPGRVLVETIENDGPVTSFIVEPRGNGDHAYVTISTDTKVRDGFLGKIEGWFTTRLLRPIYVKELKQLEEFANSS